jgi:mannose-1-phosphate guanylyltransferase
MAIHYSEEPGPLGTIGPLKLLKDRLDETFLVLNGDLITDVDLRAFREFHRREGGLVTIATTTKSIKIDLGVLECDGARLTGFQEKPTKNYLVSMGIYCMEPEILEHVPAGVPFGFDNLMHHMLVNKLAVNLYTHTGYWMDIGREEDFLRAQEFIRENQSLVIGN